MDEVRKVTRSHAPGRKYYHFITCEKCRGKKEISVALWAKDTTDYLQKLVDWVFQNRVIEPCTECEGTGLDHYESDYAKIVYNFEDGSEATEEDYDKYVIDWRNRHTKLQLDAMMNQQRRELYALEEADA